MRRFFSDRLLSVGEPYKLSKELSRHVRTVLRLKTGDRIALSDPAGREYACLIESIDSSVTVRVIQETVKKANSKPEIILCQAIPKASKMDWVVEKAAELGADRIIPFRSKRTIPKITAPASKIPRWQRIAREASRQSQRASVPEIGGIESLDNIIAMDYGNALKIVLIPGSQKRIRDLLEGRSFDSATIIVGPEGGFEDSEEKKIIESGFTPVRISRNVLRTETAGIIAVGILRYEFG